MSKYGHVAKTGLVPCVRRRDSGTTLPSLSRTSLPTRFSPAESAQHISMPPATFKKRRQKEKKGVNARLQQVDADSPSAGTTSDAEGQPVWKLPNQAL